MLLKNNIHRSDNRTCRVFIIAAVFSIALFLVMLFSTAAIADPVRPLSDKQFDQACIEMTGEYQKEISRGQAERNPYVTNRLVVKSDNTHLDPDDYGAVDAIQDRDGKYIMQFSSSAATRRAEKILEKEPATEYVEPDYLLCACTDSEETAYDSSAAEESGYGMFYVQEDTDGEASSSTCDWDVSMMGLDAYQQRILSDHYSKEIVVAVLDTGVSYNHPLLKDRVITDSRAANYVDDYETSNAEEQFAVYSGMENHGTHVAGIIAKCAPDLSIKILPMRVLNPKDGLGSSTNVINAINQAIQYGASVINLSMSFVVGTPVKSFEECIQNAVDQGIIVVVAAGNNSADISSNYVLPGYISDSIVTGSVDKNKDKANNSNYGSTLDVVAPGVSINSSILKVSDSGYTFDYGYKSGTSMAAPHVSAEAAMLRMVYDSYSAREIEALIQQNTEDLGSEGRDDYYGYGLAQLKTLSNTYSITYDLNGGEADNPVTYTIDDSFTLENPSKTGYVFTGWSGTGLTGDQNTSVTISAGSSGDREYKAHWKAIQYTIQFVDEDGETVLLAGKSYDYGTPAAAIIKPADPTKKATAEYTYSFNGWNPAITDVKADAVYRATYSSKKNTYTVTWKNFNGDTLETDKDVEYGDMPAYDGTTPIRLTGKACGYKFKGWNPTITTVTGDAEYIAEYEEIPNLYTILWLDDDGVTVLEKDDSVLYGSSPEYNGEIPVKEDTAAARFTFEGWSPEISNVTEDISYKAVYREETKYYTVTFNVNGHGAAPQSQTVAYGDTAKEPNGLLAEGYVFGGWYTDEACTNVYNFAAQVTANTDLYAKWTQEAVKEPITIVKTPKITKAKAAKSKVTIYWKKIKNTKKTKALRKQIKSIQIQYSEDPSFNSNVLGRKIGKNKTKIKLKLQRKKTYYVRIRYVGADGFSEWSKVKKIRTK